MRTFIRLLQLLSFSLCLLAVMCPSLFGQAQRAIVLGRVVDPSGGAIPGVDVKVVNVATNVARETLTNDSGNYEVPGLFPGTYRVEAAVRGFKTTTIDNVIVQSAQRAVVNIEMQIGEVADTVTVTAANERLDTATADVETRFDSTAISNIPIGQGHAAMLMLQAVGADGNPAWVGNDVQPMQRAHAIRFNGSPVGTTEYTIDGSPNTQRGNAQAGGSMAFTPSPEVVEEVRVSTAIFDASQGHTGGSTVDLTLRSGKNDYHGTAAYNWRPVELQANSWINNRQGIARPAVATKFFDLSAGGPVRLPWIYNGKDKTFFYYGFEKWSGLTPNPPGFATVPTAAQLGGDLSNLLALGPQYQLYDPESAYIAADGRIARLPFANNIIPSTRINDGLAKAMAKFWPAPNTAGSAGGVQNYGYIYQPHPRKLWGSTLRMDHNLSKGHKLYGKFLKGETGIYYTGVFDRTDIDFNHYSGRNFDLGIGDVWTISPTLIADFRVADMRFHWDVQATGEGMSYDQFGLGYLSTLFDSKAAGFPSVNLTGYPSVASVNYPTFYGTGGSRWVSEVRTAMANFTKIQGNHSIRFGFDLRQYIENWGSTDSLSISYTGSYSSGPYYNSPAPPLGAALSDFLQGRYSSATLRTNPRIAGLSTYQGIYIHDDWKITPRLTLNLGMRWEREGPASERFDRSLVGFDINSDNPIAAAAKAAYAASPIPEIPASQFQVKGGPIFAGTGGRRTLYNANNMNFAPRVGLAYRVSDNIAVKGGYGIYFIPNGQRMYANIAPGYSTISYSYSSLDSGLTFTNKTSNLFPSGLNPVTGSTLGLKTNLGSSVGVTSLLGDLPTAYNQRWQGGIEIVFAGNYKVEARYVGNRTIKMPISTPLNFVPNSYLSTSTERDQATINNLTTLVANPFYGIAGVAGSLGTARNIGKAALLYAYPQFSGVSYNAPQGWSTYNALQVELSRRFANGLTFQTNYTRARMTDADSRLNSGDPMPWAGPAPTDRPNIWRFLGVYELPFGPGKWIGSSLNPVASRIIGGWQLQGSSYFQSGAPMTAWGNVLFRGNLDDIRVDKIDPDRMFNTDAGFEKLATKQLSYNVRTFPFRLGNVRYQSDIGTDLSIIKNVEVKERYRAQIRFEAYNAFNLHRYYAAVNLDPTSTAFGKASYSTGARIAQVVVKFIF